MQTANGEPVPSQANQELPGEATSSSAKKFVLVGLVFVLSILVLGLVFYSQRQQAPVQITPTPTPISNLKTANGKIIRVDNQSKTVTIESTVVGLSKTWNIVVDDKTTLAKYNEWQKAQVALLKGSSATSDIASLNFTDLKIGDAVYLMARPEQDLASSEDVQGLGYLLVY